ncbi:DNA-binding MarR family transcriptional regulator [Virgibacillus halotolerans]|uniref:hypothetical protein n=1 Tax=Virgibacillus halotolerans TaxID=1071053 RepID=UPI001961C004|nr:hypothetical protein [Virgibacillus halotolerans]MBM7599433.1 DNA-binding MarR family transcriptional regulator [Virgibacillus halotolerans]
MRDIQEIKKRHKLNLLEISILVRLYEEHPNKVLLQDLVDDERFFGAVTNELDTLVSKGIVKIEETKYGVIWRKTDKMDSLFI